MPGYPFRFYAGALGVALCVQAIWLFGAEAIRPALPYFPADTREAKVLAASRTAAAAAALIGWPRGELLTERALTANAPVIAAFESNTVPPLDGDAAAADESAARWSPSDARGWLLLAASNASPPGDHQRAPRALKMSYYTSPYNEELFPLRILLAARSTGTIDDELRDCITLELDLILRKRPDLKDYVLRMLTTASPAVRQLLEGSLKKSGSSSQPSPPR